MCIVHAVCSGISFILLVFPLLLQHISRSLFSACLLGLFLSCLLRAESTTWKESAFFAVRCPTYPSTYWRSWREKDRKPTVVLVLVVVVALVPVVVVWKGVFQCWFSRLFGEIHARRVTFISLDPNKL